MFMCITNTIHAVNRGLKLFGDGYFTGLSLNLVFLRYNFVAHQKTAFYLRMYIEI